MLRKYTPKYTNTFRFFVSTHASPFLTYQFLLGVLLSCIYIFANNNVAFAIKRLQCPNQCGNSLDNMTTTPGVKRGVCVDGLCHCYTGFSGVDCSEGHGPKNRHTFPVKDNAVLKILEEDDTTCDSTTCFSLCSYGGSCTSKFTCKCFNKWGKGPADVLSKEKDDKKNETNTTTSSDPTKIKVFYRKPLVPKERIYLLSVMRSLGVPNPGGDPCRNQWRNPRGFLMVSCNPEGHVVGVDFGRMNLRGTISPSIGGLKHLRDIAMNNNLIRGHIPSQIGQLRELEMLLLYKNNLVGHIPDLSKTRLINLVLYGNFLTGGIPYSLSFLFQTLLMIDVSFNKLDGVIAKNIWRMERLDTFYVNHNHLHGIIPQGVNQWSHIKNMRYEENDFDNQVKNVGNAEVWSDQTHLDRTEEWGEEWKNGLVYDQRNRQRIFEEIAKKKEKEKKEVKEKLEKAAGVAAAKKGAEWQKAMIKEPEKKDEEAKGGGGGGEAAPAAGMKITDKQPSDTDVIE